MVNIMKNLTVNELRAKAKELGIKGYSRMDKETLVEYIEHEVECIENSNIDLYEMPKQKEVIANEPKKTLTKSRGMHGLEIIARNVELLGAKFVVEYDEEQRFDNTDRIVLMTKSGKKGSITIQSLFEKANVIRQANAEVAIATTLDTNKETEESKLVKAQYEKALTEQLMSKAMNRIDKKNARQWNMEEIRMNIKNRMNNNDWSLPVARGTFEERFEEFKNVLNGLANYGKFKKEYVEKLILENFTDNEPLLTNKMLETRDNHTKETMFSQFVTMYLLGANAYSHIEKELNHATKQDIVDTVFDMEFKAIAMQKLTRAKEELALENPKYPIAPASAKQIELLEKVKRNYARIKGVKLNFSIEPTSSFKTASAFLFFYQEYINLASEKQIAMLEKKGAFLGYKGYVVDKNSLTMKEASELLDVYQNAPTYNQVRAYLSILNRNGMSNVKVSKNDDNNDKVKMFINKLYFENNIDHKAMSEILGTLMNDIQLVKLSKECDESVDNSIIKACLKVAKLDNIARRMYETMMYNKSINNICIDNSTEFIKKQSTSVVTGDISCAFQTNRENFIANER